LERTSTAAAPWYVVPADKKYLRDLLVAQVVMETLERMDPKYPGPPKGLSTLRRRLR
jgi:polyphosphate kinase 2 (PPK2 family)